MINPLNFVAEILQSHKACLLPGLGIIRRDHHASSYDIRQRLFNPPKDHFTFIEIPDEELDPDTYSIIDHMATHSHIISSIAQTQWDIFKNDLQSRIKAGESIAVPGIGFLSQADTDAITLLEVHADNPINPLLPGILLQKDSAYQEALPEEEKGLQDNPSEIFSGNGSTALKKIWIWLISLVILLLLALGYIYVKELPAEHPSENQTPTESQKSTIQPVPTDSIASPAATDSVTHPLTTITNATDSSTYDFAIAQFSSRQRAHAYSLKLIHWGHPNTVINEDTLYVVCIEARLLPADTNALKSELIRNYGPHVYILPHHHQD